MILVEQIKALEAALLRVPELGRRVYAVEYNLDEGLEGGEEGEPSVVPPVCVYGMIGGSIEETFDGSVQRQGIEVAVLGSDYIEVTAAMSGVLQSISRASFLYRAPSTRTDRFDDELDLYRQSVGALLR